MLLCAKLYGSVSTIKSMSTLITLGQKTNHTVHVNLTILVFDGAGVSEKNLRYSYATSRLENTITQIRNMGKIARDSAIYCPKDRIPKSHASELNVPATFEMTRDQYLYGCLVPSQSKLLNRPKLPKFQVTADVMRFTQPKKDRKQQHFITIQRKSGAAQQSTLGLS